MAANLPTIESEAPFRDMRLRAADGRAPRRTTTVYWAPKLHDPGAHARDLAMQVEKRVAQLGGAVITLADLDEACKVAGRANGWSKPEVIRALRAAGAEWAEGHITACPEHTRAVLLATLTAGFLGAP